MEQVLKTVATAKSPVKGEQWPVLDTKGKYRGIKKKEAGNTLANMELTGEMLDNLSFKRTQKGIEIGFFGNQAPKADGHLKFSGKKGTAPRRRFLPGEGQQFKAAIQDEVDKIIVDARVTSADITSQDLRGISTSEELYSYLSEKLDLEDEQDIRDAVLRNQELVSELKDTGLLELL